MTTMSIYRTTNRTQKEEAGQAERPGSGYGFELKAKTLEGARLIEIAEEKAAVMAEQAMVHDREGSFPSEAIEALKEVKYFAGPVPERFGGLGVESVHDLLVASSRLARGDASVAIGVNMHLATVANIARAWRTGRASGNRGREEATAQTLEFIARSGWVVAAATSELNQDLTRPATTAKRLDDGGWLLNGKKIFGTMSPAADAILVSATFVNEAGEERFAFVLVPRDTPGVVLNDDWDALGMRASGSQSIDFVNVRLPAAAVRGGFPAGRLTPELLDRFLTSGPMHASASLGIAEAAHEMAVKAAAGKLAKGGSASAHMTMTAAQDVIDLSTMRAAFSRAGSLIDEYYAAHPAGEKGIVSYAALFAEVQAAKVFISEAAQRVVDRAMALSGGSGYANKHPLSKAYRDVRAGAFMHPLGANRAYDFIGALALGLEPSVN